MKNLSYYNLFCADILERPIKNKVDINSKKDVLKSKTDQIIYKKSNGANYYRNGFGVKKLPF